MSQLAVETFPSMCWYITEEQKSMRWSDQT